MRATILLGLVPVLLASCGTPPSTGKPTDPNGEAPGSPPPTAAREARFARVDNAKVKSLELVTLRADQPRKVLAEVPQVPTARNLTQAIEVVREKQLRLAHWADASQVEIRSQVVASSEEAIGVAVNSTSTESDASVQRPVTIWYDPSDAQSYSSPILIEEGRWADFKKVTLEVGGTQKLDPGKLGPALDDSPAPEGNGPAMAFDDAGDVVLQFGSGVLDGEPKGLVVPKDKVAGMLSVFGMKAQAAATRPGDYTATATAPPKTGGRSGEKSGGKSKDKGGEKPGEKSGEKGGGQTPAASGTPAAGGTATPGSGGGSRPSTAIGPDCRVLKCVALTYDDGPGPGTPKVLKAFDEAKAAATFFQLGDTIKQHPDTVRLVAATGYEVGNHSASHANLSGLSGARLDKEVKGNSDTLKELTGRAPMLFRPPFGEHKDATDKVIADSQMAIVNWSVDTDDWQSGASASGTENKVVYQGATKPSPIVLMHDIHDSTVAAAPAIVQGLQEKGVRMVTVSELTLNAGGVYPGRSYCLGTHLAQQGYKCYG